MPIIKHVKDPANITPPDIYEVTAGTNLIGWLMETFGDAESMCSGLACSVIRDGRVIFESDNEDHRESALDFALLHTDSIVIVNRPAGLDPISLAIIVFVASVAVSLLLQPSLPGQAGEQKDSPNNRLNAARNQFRPGEGIPDIMGKVVAYPDFIQPSYFEYIDNRKVQRELFCVGVGTYDIGEIRIGETPNDEIPGNTAIVYGPGDTVPAADQVTHQYSEAIEDQTLVSPNDGSVFQSDQIREVIADGIANTVIQLNLDSTAVQDMALTPGVQLFVNQPANLPGDPGELIGQFEIVGITQDVDERFLIELDTTTGTNGTAGDGSISRYNDEGEIDNWIGWFNIPGDRALSVWMQFQAPRGVRRDNGRTITITLELQIESLDNTGTPTGNMWSQEVTFVGNTLDAQFRTFKFEPDSFPGMVEAQYRGRARRITNDFPTGSSDTIQVQTFESVTPYTDANFGNVTLLSLERRASVFTQSQSSDKVNVDVTRQLGTYNRNSGTYDPDDLQTTRSFADATAYTIIVWGGRDAETVDLDELYQIYDGLGAGGQLYPELGFFDFSFDDSDVSLGERVKSICNVARVKAYRDGGIWRFARDEVKDIRSAMINRRISVGNSARQNWQPQLPDDKDSVALTYVDPDSNTDRTINRRIDLNTGEIVSDDTGAQKLEIKLAGCTSLYQATNRIELEIRRIAYQRRNVSETVLRDGLYMGMLERVGWIDPNDTDYFDGEILGIDGDAYSTSERFEPVDGVSYLVYLVDNEGVAGNPVACTARADTEFGFVASGLGGYLASGDEQLSSRYVIASESELSAADMQIISRKPSTGSQVDVEMVEYRPEIYERDVIGPPANAIDFPATFTATGSATDPDDAMTKIRLNSDGTAVAGEGATEQEGLWYTQQQVGIGNQFEVMFEFGSGEVPSGSPVDVWIPLSSDVEWTLSRDGLGVTSATGTIMARELGYDNQSQSAVLLEAVVSSLVSVPDNTVLAQNPTQGGTATAQINYNTDGTITEVSNGIETPGGQYTDQSPNIGARYEIMATITSGSGVTGSPLDTWLPLDGSTRFWRVVINGGVNFATIDVTIREIANPTNSDSGTVNLNAISGPLV